MLYFNRIHVFERTDVNKTSESNKCDIFHDWYFLNKAFKFQPNVCNWCHKLLMISMNLHNITLLNIEGSDYGCIISGISKNGTINFKQNINLIRKNRTL